MGRLALAACLAAFSAAAAADYPDKPVRLIVPFPPGGAAEIGARIFAQPLSQVLGQTVVIETKPGADGAIAADAVKRAAPDGYTLFYATNTAFNWVPATKKEPPYDPLADFTPVSLVGYFGFFLFTNAQALPARNVQELIAYAKANPGKLNYGTGNSTSQLLGAQLGRLNGIEMVNVPYKGDGPLNVDLVGGRVQMAFATPGAAVPHVKEGRLRCLAAMFPKRSPLLPECPAAEEAGLGQMTLRPWGGIFGPARMPKAIVQRLESALAGVLARQEVQEGLGKIAFQARSSTPEELTAFLKEQMEVWRTTARSVGIEAQ
ncbi:MAG TPA: tripartite tricarboxylate transporter substrate binding protein [Burkholderiales bacterium]|nr:tripartite tricarboxylate transporter substrate binding protein [Burkholderiales bacterium]